jgi:hypothetical protein
MASDDKTENIKRILEQRMRLEEKFQDSATLDSMVFVEIPRTDLDVLDYKHWLVETLETEWMRDFNQNKEYLPIHFWNEEEGGIYGNFDGVFVAKCKLYRYNGTVDAVTCEDYRGKRGYLIRDHYSETNVAKVQIIADNLCRFLQSKSIEHTRINFDRATRKPIVVTT